FYKTKKMPDRYSIPSDHKLMKITKILFDPIIDKSFDIEIASIIDKASITSSKSYIPLTLSLNKKIMIDSKIESKQPFNYFSKKQSMEISLATPYGTKVFYKNQFVDKDKLPIFEFLNFNINILGDDASEVLTIDRNSIRDEYREKLTKKVFDLAFEYLTKRYNEFVDSQKIFASMFLNFYYNKIKVEKYDAWKKYEIEIEGKKYKLGDLLNKITKLEIIKNDEKIQIQNRHDTIYTYDEKNKELTIDIGVHSNIATTFISSILSKYFIVVEFDMKNYKKTFYKSGKKHIFTSEDIQKILNKQNRLNYSRTKIPCLDKYKKLRLKDNAHRVWLKELDINIYGIKIPSMLSPYFSKCEDKDYMFLCRDAKLEYRVNDKVIKWVYKNRYDRATTKEDIKSTYEQFKADFPKKLE
ncbi:MAG: hypothetical protein P8Y49_08720, partial [Sulfurovaceae bacterium]